MITLWDRVKMQPNELRDRSTHIIKKYNSHFNEGDYEISFLIAQSLFEDRVNVLWILGAWFNQSEDYWDVLKPDVRETKNKSITSKIYELKDWEVIDYPTANRWKKLMIVRNNLIHFSLFNTDEYTEKNSSQFFKEFRVVDRIIGEFKTQTNFYESK